MAKKSTSAQAKKPNVFMRIGMFIKQIVDEMRKVVTPVDEMRKVVTPTSKELFFWALAVLVFVLFLMAIVTGMDLGLGKLMLWMFG